MVAFNVILSNQTRMKFKNKYIFLFPHYKHPINRLPTTNCKCQILYGAAFFFFQKTVWKVSSYRRVSQAWHMCTHTGPSTSAITSLFLWHKCTAFRSLFWYLAHIFTNSYGTAYPNFNGERKTAVQW